MEVLVGTDFFTVEVLTPERVGGKCQNDSLASEEPELEFVCGALGEVL